MTSLGRGRRNTLSLFAVLDTAAGEVIGRSGPYTPAMLRLALLLVLLPSVALADITGPARVIDGDTIEVAGQRIRLHGIATPEWNQPGGEDATVALHRLTTGKRITCYDTGERSHGRVVATCHLPDNRDLGEILVSQGYARDCPRYSGGRYADAEAQAQADGVYLFRTYRLPRYCQR